MQSARLPWVRTTIIKRLFILLLALLLALSLALCLPARPVQAGIVFLILPT